MLRLISRQYNHPQILPVVSICGLGGEGVRRERAQHFLMLEVNYSVHQLVATTAQCHISEARYPLLLLDTALPIQASLWREMCAPGAILSGFIDTLDIYYLEL